MESKVHLERFSLWAKRGMSIGLVLLIAWMVSKHGWALWRYAPDGHASLWRFLGVTFALWLAPGLCWFRWGVKACPSSLDHCLGVVVGSVTTSGLMVWALHFVGLYYVQVAWTLVVVLFGLGMVAFPWRSLVKVPGRVCRSLESLSWVELSAFSMVVLFGATLCLQATGAPLTSWDAIVSWDKWASDMAERQGFGRYLLGGYPQLLPSLCSVSYKLAGSWDGGFPDEQLLMHGYAAPFAILLLFSIIRLCRTWGIPWVPCILLSMSIGSLQEWWISGYVDVPATALIVSALVLLTSLLRGTLVMKSRYLAIGWIGVILFGVGFIKGYGLLWVIFIPILTAVAVWRLGGRPALSWKLLVSGVGLAVLLLSPFYVHQRFLTTHMEQVDSNSRLHSFALDVNKPGLYDHSASAVRARIMGEVDGIGHAWKARFALLPPEVRRVLIGVGVLGGALPGGAPAVAGAMMLQWWVWEKTAAYDSRNLLPALILLCVLFSLGWKRVGVRMGRVGPALGVMAAMAITWPWLTQEVTEIAGCIKDAGSRGSVGIWAERIESRLRRVSPHQFFVRVIAEQSPLGKRAHYIYAPDELYRHLGARGIYTLKGNVFTDVQPGDLLICNKNEPEPAAFTPIATLRFPGYEKLLCAKLALVPTSWSVTRSEGVTVSNGAAGLTVTGEGWLTLKIESLIAANSGDSIILGIQFGSPEEAAACSLELPDSWDTITNIRSRVCPITDGVWIRAVIWLDRGEGFVPGNSVDRTVQLRIPQRGSMTVAGIWVEHLKDSL
jgi:hypothetical protein